MFQSILEAMLRDSMYYRMLPRNGEALAQKIESIDLETVNRALGARWR